MFANDVLTVLHLCRPGVRVLIDDVYVSSIAPITQRLVEQGFLEPFADLKSRESACYTVLKTFAAANDEQFRSLVGGWLADVIGAP